MSKKPEPGTNIAVPGTEEQNQAIEAVRLQEEADLLAFYGDNAKDGKENITSDDIILPRLAILQALSPQVKERKGMAGDICNTVTGVNYGNEGLNFVPLLFYGTRIKWASANPGADIECVARDGENGSKYGKCTQCRFKEFSTDAAGKSVQPMCTEFKNVLLIPLPDDEAPQDQAPVAFSAKRAAISVMKEFLTQIQQMRYNGRELPMYANTWRLRVGEQTNEKGSYYVPKFENLGRIQDIKLLMYLKGIYDNMKQSQSKFVIPQEQDEVTRPHEATDAEFSPRPETEIDY